MAEFVFRRASRSKVGEGLVESYGKAAELALIFQPASSTLAGRADGLLEQAKYKEAETDASLPEKEQSAVKLLLEAERCLLKDDCKGASTAALEAVDMFRELQKTDEVADAYRIALHALHYEESHPDLSGRPSGPIKPKSKRKSIDLATSELERFRSVGDTRGEAMMKLSIAEIKGSAGTYDEVEEALKKAEEARNFFHDKDPWMEGRAVLAIIDMSLHKKGEQKDIAGELWGMALEAQDFWTQANSLRGEALSGLSIAVARAFNDKLDSAIKSTRDAADRFRKVGLLGLEALALENMSRFYLLNRDPAQAEYQAEKALLAAKKAGVGCRGAAPALEALIEARLDQGAVAKALQTAQEELKAFNASGNQMGEATALHMLARVYHAQNSLAKGSNFAEEAASMFGNLGCKKEEMRALRSAVAINIARGQHDSAVHTAKEAMLKVAKQIHPTYEALAKRTLVEAYVAQGKLEEAMKECRDESALYRAARSDHKQALVMLKQASILSTMGDYEKALSNATEAQALMQKSGDMEIEARAWSVIAEAQKANEKYNGAVWAAERAKKLYQDSGRKQQIAAARLLLADVHFGHAVQNFEKGGAEEDTQRMVDDCLFEGSEALELARAIGDHQQQAAALFMLARARISCMMLAEGLTTAMEAAEVYRKHEDDWNEASSLLLCAYVHVLREQPGRAGKAASRAMLLFSNCMDFRAEGVAASIFDRTEMIRQMPPPMFPLKNVMRPLGIPKVCPGLGFNSKVIFGGTVLKPDAPLMQGGMAAGAGTSVGSALADWIVQSKTAEPALL